VNYYKSVSNDAIREQLKKSHIFAYPSTWKETSCLCLMEAMSAGLLSVHSSLAALPETSMGLTNMYGYVEDPQQHANQFYFELKNAIELHRNPNAYTMLRKQLDGTKSIADYQFDWSTRKLEWNSLMKNLLT